MNEETMQVVMGLIMQGGNAKGFAFEAIRAAKDGDFETADDRLFQANDALLEAHNVQTEMLTKEANGQTTPVNLYMVHAQDWLMTGLTFVDLAREIVALYRKISEA